MKDTTKETIENMISYYRQHSMVDFVKGDGRLRNFVTDDFTQLLTLLEQEVA